MDDGGVAERAEENARIRGAVEVVDAGGRDVQWNEEAWRRSVDEFEHGFGKMDAVAAMIEQLDRVKDDFIPDEETVETVVSDEFVECMWALLDDQGSYVMGLRLMTILVFVVEEFVELLVETDGITRICELFRKGPHNEDAVVAQALCQERSVRPHCIVITLKMADEGDVGQLSNSCILCFWVVLLFGE